MNETKTKGSRVYLFTYRHPKDFLQNLWKQAVGAGFEPTVPEGHAGFYLELAHAAGKDAYRYRRELIAGTTLPYKDDMIRALDMAAEMSGWGERLPAGTARAIALEERAGKPTVWRRSAMVHTVSVSRGGKVKLECVGIAHETGFGLVNPLSVKKQRQVSGIGIFPAGVTI